MRAGAAKAFGIATAAMVAAVGVVIVGCGSDDRADDTTPGGSADTSSWALQSAVDIEANGCRTVAVRGGGSLIDGNHILTAAHVVSGAESITVRTAAPGATATEARLVAIDPVNDLALLVADTAALGDLRPLTLGSPAAGGATGDAVVFRDGSPVVLAYSINRPVVVRILDIHHEQKVSRPGYEVGITIAAGDSGAVMVAEDGAAVGVLYAKSRADGARAFASDTSAVADLVAAAAGVDRATGIRTGECV